MLKKAIVFGIDRSRKIHVETLGEFAKERTLSDRFPEKRWESR